MIDDGPCYRTEGSFAYQLMMDDDEFFDGDEDKDFKLLACTGGTGSPILQKQIVNSDFGFQDNQGIYTHTAGGNDLAFADLVKACVYGQANEHGQDCERLPQTAENMVKGEGDFLSNLTAQGVALAERKGNGRVLVIPYPRFLQRCNRCQVWNLLEATRTAQEI